MVSAAKIHVVPSDEETVQISQKVAYKWKQIGIRLGVDEAKLEQIAYEYHSQCCSELFRKCTAREVTASCPFTWKGLIEALDSDCVSLARHLESTYL